MDPLHADVCPNCPSAIETHWHLLACRAPNRIELWKHLQTELLKTFDTHHINPGIRQVIFNLLIDLLPDPPLKMISISYIRLTISQQWLGCRPLFFGMFTKDWARIQHSFLKRNYYPYDKNQAWICLLQIGLLLA